MSDDFCLSHGYEHMRSQLGNPIPYCEQCEREREHVIGPGVDELRFGWNGPRNRRWNGTTQDWEPVESDWQP
jgi:hypothetical protein